MNKNNNYSIFQIPQNTSYIPRPLVITKIRPWEKPTFPDPFKPKPFMPKPWEKPIFSNNFPNLM